MATLEVTLAPADGDPTTRKAELAGVIDSATLEKLERELGGLLGQGVRRLIVLMNKVRYVNDEGLEALERLTQSFREAGGGVALVGVGTRIRLMIDMMGKAQALLMCADEAEAQNALGQATQSPEPVEAASAPAGEPSAPHAPQPSTPAAVPAAALYPAAVTCSGCGIELELAGPGNWRCPRCHVLLAARGDGAVSFSEPADPGPFELVMHGGQAAYEALEHFVATLGRPVLGEAGVATLSATVGETARSIVQNAYGGDETQVWQVAVEPRANEVEIRFADHGQTLEASRLQHYFPMASTQASAFECTPHPNGGNVLRLVVRA